VPECNGEILENDIKSKGGNVTIITLAELRHGDLFFGKGYFEN